MRNRRIDKIFLWLTISLSLGGFFIFTSASFKLLSTKSESGFLTTIGTQFFLGIVCGFIVLTILSSLNYLHIKKYAFWIFILSVVATLLIYVPGLGQVAGGAKRWINIGALSFQPAEFLKLGTILYLASFLSVGKDQIKTFSRGILPLMIILAVVGAILLSQPDTDTYGFIVFSAMSMFIAAGGKWKHLALACVAGVIIFLILAETRPYLKARIETFIHPSAADSLGSGYQIDQSLIAIGSGRLFGKGFGQSIQKFGFLPEPTTDSIFAVAAEEFGFVGSSFLIILFTLFGARGVAIAKKTSNNFGKLVVIGIISLIISESFVNIAALTGLIPLAGTPLLFVSHGGTALFFVLAACGIVLSVSRRPK